MCHPRDGWILNESPSFDKGRGLYVGQCIGRDTGTYLNGYHPPCEMRGLKGNQSTWRMGYDEQLTARCLPQFGGGAA